MTGAQNRGAVVLCGGSSRRMGRDKASLPLDGETLLARTVRLVGSAVPAEQVVCVAAAGQKLPKLPSEVRVKRDLVPDQGPLAALSLGLTALAEDCHMALAVGCDAPLLAPELVELLFCRLGTAQAVYPQEAGQAHPLPGVYRVGTARQIVKLLASGERSLHGLLERIESVPLTAPEIESVDPGRLSLVNCNTPEDYQTALRLLHRDTWT